MDHLPYPDNPATVQVIVPYHCSQIFETHEWCRDEHGAQIVPTWSQVTDRNTKNTIDRTAHSSQELLAMAQAFIYFGLLKEILGEEFHLEDFLTQRDTEGGQIVTLKTLAQKLSNLRGQQNEYSIALAEMGNGVSVEKFGYLKKVNEDIRGKLRRGIGWAVWLLQDIDAAEEASVLCLSLEILAWSLSKCLPLTVDLAVAFRWLEYDGKLIFENRLLLRRFKEAGWCPHLSRRYTRANSAALLYYASALRQSRHEDCTESKCIAYDVDENQSYKMEHAKKGCQCGLRGPDMNRVKAIIASGGIPLIKLTRKETVFSRLFGIDSFNNECTECLDVDVEEYKPGMEYIAISHVWVDGLGNPNDNSIHECQLEYLYRVLRGCDPLDYSPTRLRYSHYDHKFAWEEHNVPVMGRGTGNTQRKYHGLEPWRRPWNKPSVWMWIDTLCVPCGKDRLRRLALNTMAMTYALADQVAVIDRTMSNVSFASSSDLEVALRLLSSPWMARCWTYQEACLARKYSFVLKDGMLSPSWWSRVNESNFVDRCGTQMEQRLKYECLEWFDEIPSIMAIASSGELDDFLETLMELLYPPIWRYLKESFLRSEDAGGSDAEALKAFDEETKRQSAAAHAQRRRFFDLHKRSHSITSNQLTNIWNQVSSRGTTKREDLHGILAALLGLSVSEVLDIAVNERLRAVLKTLDRLPLEMMYCWYSPADRAIPGCNWIPTYPTGRLIWEDPITKLGRCETGQYMKWNSEWNLEVSCMPPVMRSAGQFIVSSSQNLYHEFLLGHVEDLAPDGVQKYFVNDVCSRSIKVVILGTDPVISRSSHGLLISLAWNNEKAGTGAIFRPRSPWQRAEADKPPTVEFIAAVQFYQLDCAGLNGSDEESQRLPMIKIDGEMQYDASFIIEMDAESWPTLQYRRISGELLANGTSGGIFRIVISAWAREMCCLYFLAADLLWAGPFSRWSLISTAALWATSYVFIQIELDFDWVERQIIKDRYDAVAHTFNVKDGSAVEEASEHAKSRSSTKLYSKPILLARLSLAAICFAGVYFSPRFAVRHVRRLGGMLVAEVALRACCEILFNKSSLSRWSSWKDTLESLQDFSVTVGDKLIEEKRQARDTGEMPPFAKRVAWVLGAFWAS